MKEFNKNRWVKAFEKSPENDVLKHLPIVRQMRQDLHRLREDTVPQLHDEVSSLRKATRQILELLEMEVDGDLADGPPDQHDLSKDKQLGEIPELKSEPATPVTPAACRDQK